MLIEVLLNWPNLFCALMKGYFLLALTLFGACVAFKSECTNVSVVTCWRDPLWLNMSSVVVVCQGML